MTDYLKLVEEFNHSFNDFSKEEIDLTDEKINNLRISLLEEELNELKEALAKGDKVGVLDAFADLQFVLSGGILKLGYKKVFNPAFIEVHESNMSKFCNTIEEAELTIEKYKKESDVDSHYIEKDGKYLIYRTADNKILKSINYKPFDGEKYI